MRFSKLFALVFFLVYGLSYASEVSGNSIDRFPELVAKEIQANAEEAAKVKKGMSKYNPVPVIMNHIADAHDWHLWGEGENNMTIPLPVILIDDGLKFFMSSAFYHNEQVAEVSGNHYFNYGGKIYKTDADGSILRNVEGEIINEKPLDFSITKNVASMFMSMILMILIFVAVASNYNKKGSEGYIPRGIAGFMEPIIIFIRDEVAVPNIGEKKYSRYMPYLLTLFFFIWINNLLGLMPGAANLTGNIAFTLVMAVIALLVINLSGNKGYWGHMLWMPGVPVPVKLLLAPIELIGVITKPFALMIRLFANITAGHIIIFSLVSLIFIFQTEVVSLGALPLTLFIYVLELLVAALQAFIFTMLVALFIGTAVADHETEMN